MGPRPRGKRRRKKKPQKQIAGRRTLRALDYTAAEVWRIVWHTGLPYMDCVEALNAGRTPEELIGGCG